MFLRYLFNLLFDKDQVVRSDLVPTDLLPGKGRYCWVLVKDVYATVKAFVRQQSMSASITAGRIQPQRYNLYSAIPIFQLHFINGPVMAEENQTKQQKE